MDGPLVMIEWVDACGCSTEWRNIEELKKDRLTVCKSVGWLVNNEPNDDDFVTIIPHQAIEPRDGAKEQGCGDMTIPRAAITKIMVLKTTIDKPAVVVEPP